MPAPTPRKLLDQVETLKYATVAEAPVYRAVVDAFFRARERYVIELRPAEVLSELESGPWEVEVQGGDWLDRKLDQLFAWGNLARRHDSAAVARVEDFYRRSFVYALTTAGEVAHRAIAQVEATVGRSGSLQTTMLVKIRDSLTALAVSDDPAELHGLVHDVLHAFDTLTEEASRFLAALETRHADETPDAGWFDAYKTAVVTYVDRFVSRLREVAAEIEAQVRAVDERGVETILAMAVRSGELPPAMAGTDPAAEWIASRWERFRGLAAWFVRAPGSQPIVSRLADAAVDAVLDLTRTLTRLNDQRVRPIDRAADFRTLACWFAHCENDESANRIFQGAFGLYGARHFVFVDDDSELTHPSTSWWDARPVEVPVRLRSHGRISRAGRHPQVKDRSSEREWLAQRRRKEQARVDEGLARLSSHGPLQFSKLGEVDELQFDLLLMLLDEGLSGPADPDGVHRTRTGDGRFDVQVAPPADGLPDAVLSTPRGRLRCRDYTLVLTPVTRSRHPVARGNSA